MISFSGAAVVLFPIHQHGSSPPLGGRKRRGRISTALLVSAAGALSALTAAPARAGTFTLSTSSSCSLTAAVNAINAHSGGSSCGYTVGGADVISVPRGGTFVSTSQVELHRSATIQAGSGTGTATLSGNMTSNNYFIRLVDLSGSNSMAVTIQDVTINRTSGGTSTNGVYAQHVTLTLNRVRVTGFGFGGVQAYNSGLNVNDSIIDNNTSVGDGGGIWFDIDVGDAICNAGHSGDLRVKRSQISNNGAANSGGGIYYNVNQVCGETDVWNSTISTNTASDGGGIAQVGGQYFFLKGATVAFNTAINSGGGAVTIPFGLGVKLQGSIMGQNSAPSGPDISGQLNELTNSLLGSTSGMENDVDQIGSGVYFHDTSPNLDPTLRDLGGPNHTKVHRPMYPTFALDAFNLNSGPLADEMQDQRQVLRPQSNGGNLMVDMGAFESSLLEAESIIVAGRSSVPFVVVNDGNASAGAGMNLQATQTGQFVTFSSGAVLPSGTYHVRIGYRKGPSAGQFVFQAGPSTTGPWITFPTQNARASTASWTTVDLGNITASTTSMKFFKFSVPSGATSPFQIFPDFIEFTKQ